MEIHLDEKYFRLIKAGVKIVEGRRATEQYMKLVEGDAIKFVTESGESGESPNKLEMCAKVTGVKKYPSFAEMLIAEGIENCLPGITDLSKGVEIYRSFPGYAEDEKLLGVVGIRFTLSES